MAKSKNVFILNRLEEIYLQQGMSDSKLAKLTGIHRKTIHDIRKGYNGTSIVFALKIANALKLEVEEIFKLTTS